VLTIESLTVRYGLSDRALRRRIDALGPVIERHIRRGQNNALLFTNDALAILDRLAQIQRESGVGLREAAAQVKNELGHGRSATAEQRPESAELGPEVQKLIQSYEDRIEEQRKIIHFLQEQLEERDYYIRALMPGPPQPTPTSNGTRWTRWRALKYALFGHG
jgi:hypothetical protein